MECSCAPSMRLSVEMPGTRVPGNRLPFIILAARNLEPCRPVSFRPRRVERWTVGWWCSPLGPREEGAILSRTERATPTPAALTAQHPFGHHEDGAFLLHQLQALQRQLDGRQALRVELLQIGH